MVDAGAFASAEKLIGRPIPEVVFVSTAGSSVQLADGSLGDFVLFIYPRISRPDDPVSTEWLHIPGAKGCTAESCEFRDLATDFRRLGVSIYGLSTQNMADQAQAAERLHLPYALLSDPGLRLQRELGLPTFAFEGQQLYQRSTLVVRGGAIAVAQLDVKDAASHPHELLALLRGAA